MAAARCSSGTAATWESDDPEARFQEGRPEIQPARREAAWQLGAGADASRPQRRQAHQLAPDQASRRICTRGRGERHPRGGPLGRVGPDDEADRGRQGQGAKAVHAGEERQAARPMRSGTPTAARQRKRARSARRAKPAKRGAGQAASIPFPISSRRSSAPRSSGRRPAKAGATRSSSTATAMQLRVEDGKATLKTRKGLDWTDKFEAIAKEGSALPDVLIDGEIVALDHDGVPEFLGAAGRAFRRQDREADLLRLRSAVRGGHGFAAAAAARAQGAAEGAARRARQGQVDPLCRAFRGRRRCRAEIGVPNCQARRHHLEEAAPRPIIPAAPKAGPRPRRAPARRS